MLCAVFVPCAFISGITGQFFRQFALTIAVSTVISAFNSLTLSPALAALLLKPHGAKRDPLDAAARTWLLGWFFRLFNAAFDCRHRVLHPDGRACCCAISLIVLLVYGGLLYLTYWSFTSVPDRLHPGAGQGLSAASTCSCPTRRRCSARGRSWPRSRSMARETPGRRAHGRHLRPVADR